MKPRHLLTAALLLVLLACALALAGNAGQWLFDTLKAHQAQLSDLATRQPLLSALAYSALLVTVTALSIPVATALALAAGAVFGFAEALLLTMFGATTGATLAMLLARYAFRDAIETRWPGRVERINRGIARDGSLYLLVLRLAPTPPFFVINLSMGMTRMRARTFFLVTLLGVAPLEALIVNAGNALAEMRTPTDALTPPVLATFALLAIVPLLLRRLLRCWRRARRHRARAPV